MEVCIAILYTNSVFSTVLSVNCTFEFCNHSPAPFSIEALPSTILLPLNIYNVWAMQSPFQSCITFFKSTPDGHRRVFEELL
ncbi:MAG: hypothetical protein JWR61_4337 [Ferruginibacter sp.]|nr:hypothetical protein [Ferruginibacter sp.]